MTPEVLFKSKSLRIGRQNSNESSLETFDRNNNRSKSSSTQYQLKMIDFDDEFLHGLAHYAKLYPNFKRSIYWLFVRLCSTHTGSDQLIIIVNYGRLRQCLNQSTIGHNLTGVEVRLDFFHLNHYNPIIRTWTTIVNSWLNKKRQYDCHWAILSTLGGAYSSLGEICQKHAKKAETVSIRQLKLSYSFNDPNAVCRCFLFLSFSYIQQRKFQEAQIILDNQYKFLFDKRNEKIINDHKLAVMCIAGRKKLALSKKYNKNIRC